MSASNDGQGDDDNLDGVDDATESSSVAAPQIRVVLRIRAASPAPKKVDLVDVYAVETATSLLVKSASWGEHTWRSKAGNEAPNAYKRFFFNQIFEAPVDQEQFFAEAVLPSVLAFLNQEDCSLIAYGSTCSGKTHTLYGTLSNPGVIARSIGLIFASIDCNRVPWYKPEHWREVVSLDGPARELEIEVSSKFLSSRLIDRAVSVTTPNEAMFSLWISFVEIYNDSVYDLLQVDDEGKNVVLKLSIDKHGSSYVQGMRSVCATSAQQACEILNAGQARLSTTMSTSNYKSSRSHSIFSMRLLKYNQDSTASTVQVSAISFYDLAAASKWPKSHSHFKESRSINTSLLAFGRCLKALVEGHSRKSNGPFRDCKLTRLVQHSIRRENLVILIALNPALELVAETQNVLNFAETAIKLTSDFAKEEQRSPENRSTQPCLKLAERRSSPLIRTPPREQFNEIMAKNKQLLGQMKQLKSNELSREYRLRQDLADFYTKQLNDLEELWKNRMSAAEQQKDYLLKLSVDGLENCNGSALGEHLNRPRTVVHKESISSAPSLPNENILDNVQLEKASESTNKSDEQAPVGNRRYAFEVSWLKDILKRAADLIGPRDKCDNSSSENCQYINDDTIKHIQSVVAFVRESRAREQAVEVFYKSNLSSKETQSDLDLPDLSLLDEQCQRIEALLALNVDDSQDSSNEHVCLEGLVGRLSQIRRSIAECLAYRNQVQLKNENDERELLALRREIEERNIEMLRMKQQLDELESSRLSLLSKRDSLEVAFESREFFENADLDINESENSMVGVLTRGVTTLQRTETRSTYTNESQVTRSDSDGSKNDSGLGLNYGEEKYCQTDQDHNETLRSKLMQLNSDYNRMEARHLQESTRIRELSVELEGIREATLRLKENISLKDRAIGECRRELNDKAAKIDRLTAEKGQLENQLYESQEHFMTTSRDYERKLDESQVKLRDLEEEEQKATRRSKAYWHKSVDLGCRLAIAYSLLQKFSTRCREEHVTKIRKLEEELTQKKMSLDELNERMRIYEKDSTDMAALSGKVDQCENAQSQLEKQRNDLQTMVGDGSEKQLMIENQVQSLTETIEKRDEKIISLKCQLEKLSRANSANSSKAKELRREVRRLAEKMDVMKDDIAESEAARSELERKSSRAIDNLRARLTIFEGNTQLLNFIRDSDESKQREMEKLKLKILEKDKELEFFKTNRNATIRRYDSLVEKLQRALKINRRPDRAKRALFFKKSSGIGDMKETKSCCYIHGSHSRQRAWDNEDKRIFLWPRPSLWSLGDSSERNGGAATELSDDLEARDRRIAAINPMYKDLRMSRNNCECRCVITDLSDNYLDE